MADHDSLFERAAQLASTARQHVEAAYQGVDPADADSRASGREKLKQSLTTFGAKALEKGVLDQAGVERLYQTATVFANAVLVARLEARGSSGGSEDALDEKTASAEDGGTADLTPELSSTNLNDDDLGLAPQ